MTSINYLCSSPRAAAFTRTLLLALALLGCVWPLQAQDRPQPRLETTAITAGIHLIRAELAITPDQQAMGMMWRREMADNEGMLFVNADSSVRCFWMRNTLVALSIAFIAEDGSIVNIADMQPLSEQSHCSNKPVRFALEMRQGWFARKGIKPGLKLRGAPFGN